MAVQIQGNGGTVAEVGGTVFRGQHVHLKPLEYGVLGHYRSSVRFSMATSQGANSRLWEVRNSGSNLIIPTRLFVSVMSAGTVTGAYRLELNMFRLTNFTAVDTTNTVTPTVSPRKTTMAAAPGAAQIRHVTVAGNASGMTGGTLTKDGGAAAIREYWAATAAATTFPMTYELVDDVNGTHPFNLAQNEGLEIENVTTGSATSNVISVSVDFSWAEVAAY